jgi:hypothetical protein
MPGENENHRNLSHHGLKEAEGFVTHSNVGFGTEMPFGLPTGAAAVPSARFERAQKGSANPNLTSGTAHDRLKTGANAMPGGRK